MMRIRTARSSTASTVSRAPRLHGALAFAEPLLLRAERVATALALWIVGIVAANTGCTGLELSIGLWFSGHRHALVQTAARLGFGVSAELVPQTTRTRRTREDGARGSRR